MQFMFMDLLVNGESLIWIEGKKKTGCIMILFFVLFTDEYDFVKLSVCSCSVSVGADAH